MSNVGRTLPWRCAGPVLQCWRLPRASVGSRPTSNSQHCKRRWQFTKPSIPPIAPLNPLPRRRNLLNRRCLPSKFQQRPGQPHRSLRDILALQDEITLSTIGGIEPSLKAVEIERVKRKRPENLDTYDFVLRA